MAAIDTLNEDIHRYTIGFRKEEEVVKTEQVGGINVITVNGYPRTPSRGDLVDVHFLNVGFTEAAANQEWLESSLYQAIAEGQGAFGVPLTRDDWAGGPSYITVGGWLGSQDSALRLFALIKHYGLGDLITPTELHITDPVVAAELAGRGMVMCTLRRVEPLAVGSAVVIGIADAEVVSIDTEDENSSDGQTYTIRTSSGLSMGSLRRQSFQVAPVEARRG